ncbi:helicase-related protein [Novosphingobium colocasiae]
MRAEGLAARFEDDPKFRELVRQVKDLTAKKDARPVIFCRFITTAEAVGEALRAQFKKHEVEIVTGRLTPEERRGRVEAMVDHPNRILVATDCLSEGINLQSLFNAVIHYDLNWNPTRHQQRDGRVDRFGQPEDTVWSVMMFGSNSIIDGAVIKVITEKMKRIQQATGVIVPVPEDSASVSNALMQAMLLHSSKPRAQGLFDFGDAEERLEMEWKDAEENARKSQTRYAQAALKPDEVLPEWHRLRELLGGPDEVERFTRRALARIDTPLGAVGSHYRVSYEDLPKQLGERLAARNLTGTRAIGFADKLQPDVAHVGRTHPLVAMLAETMAEGALDPGGVEGKATLGRCGAWRSAAVNKLTTVLLLRLRFKLTTSGRKTLLAEEATALAFATGENAAIAQGAEALALLEPDASGDIAPPVITRQVDQALARLPEYDAAIRAYAQDRAAQLSEDHDRVKFATRGEGGHHRSRSRSACRRDRPLCPRAGGELMGRSTRAAELGLVAVTIEGGLIAPEQVQKIVAADRTAKTAEGYGCPKGTGLGDEISRYFRIGQHIWKDYDRIDTPTVTQTAQFAQTLLTQCFGFTDLAGPVEHQDGTRRYRLAWEAKDGRVPVVVAAPVVGADAFNKAQPEFGDGEGGRPRRSPVSLLQDWLNATDHALWGIVFAGDRVRLMRDNASLTRPAWIEADLGAMFRDEIFADFTAWWLIAHATRFGTAGAPPSESPLEQWREEGMKQGIQARTDLRRNVEEALFELGQGLVEANPGLVERIRSGALPLQSLFGELLRTVYRLIFLAVAEDRDLLHPRRTPQAARSLYANSYSFTFWRERSRRRVARDGHHDAWEAMKVTLSNLEHGQDLLGLPALGGLFANSETPALNDALIPNRRFLSAIFCLGFIRKDGVTHRINWRDLKTEELGSVYESLLEIRPPA